MLNKIKKLIQSKVEYLSIKQKLHSGFRTILGFMLVVVLVTMMGLIVILSNINTVIEDHQPTLITTIELSEQIYRVSSALGFYLISHEEVHLTNYEASLIDADNTLDKLKTLSQKKDNQKTKTLIADIEENVIRFKQHQKQLFELATNYEKNYPGITYAAAVLNPISQNMLNNMYFMIQSETAQKASKGRRDILIGITDFRYTWTNLMNSIRGYLAYRHQNALDDAAIFREKSMNDINRLLAFNDKNSKAPLTFEQEDSLDNIIQMRKNFLEKFDLLVNMHGGDEWRTDAFLIRKEVGPILRELNEKLATLEKFQREEIDSANNTLVTSVVFIIILGIVMLAAAIFAATYMSRQLIKSIVDPLQEAVEATGRIASGDLTVKLEETSEDEIGQLIVSLNMMSLNLGELVSKVQQSGIQVTSSSTEIAATAKQQEATVNEQATTANQISTTATEISATTMELVDTMDEVTQVTESTAVSAANSQTALNLMEQTMHQMMDATSNISSKLSVLSEKAANINSVVTTITKVADQTNLLSLNAAIEAEKAGEYGIGFSVVATEIRRLADQTAVATWDIEQMVKDMQSAVSAGVMGMDKFSDEVRNGVDEVRHVGTQLADIIEQVQNLLPSFAAVHEGMQNQSLSAQQITESISQLSDGTQQTADSLRQSGGSITQLHTAARALQDGVSRFKIKSGT